jgi:hypothetical protein
MPSAPSPRIVRIVAARRKRNTLVRTVHRWVCLAMDRMIEEPAKAVLQLELARLNESASASHHHGEQIHHEEQPHGPEQDSVSSANG